jgi:hypothetical protein
MGFFSNSNKEIKLLVLQNILTNSVSGKLIKNLIKQYQTGPLITLQARKKPEYIHVYQVIKITKGGTFNNNKNKNLQS